MIESNQGTLGAACASTAFRRAALLAAVVTAIGSVHAPTASASSVTSAVFTGSAGTVTVGGTLYAKQGATLTLTVKTSSDTECVAVTGAATLPRQSSSTAKSNWTFTTTAPVGNGAQAFTVAASPNFNSNNCTGQTSSTQASYTLDNTGPVVAAALTPEANAAGWNNSDVTVKWTATDAGSGVATAQPFKTDSVASNGITTLTALAQSDRLGNTGSTGTVTVRVDKAKPTITAAQTKNADGTTTVTFTCSDSNSGGGDASGIASCLADGSTTNSKTVQPGVTVTGTATDKAGNTATASSTAPAGDSTAPTLSGAPTTQPNGNGWYDGDVTIHWTAADPESGIPTAPADTKITGEGSGLTSSQTVRNGAGLSTTATSSPAVKIDRTAPTTGISGTSNNWVNGNVTVSLAATDNLSTVAKTEYTVDGGAAQTGTSFTLSTEGDHTISYFSTDKAGNAETLQTAHVKIDKTAPSISHTFTPLSYEDGAWTNSDVTVTFECTDQGGSGVAGCTDAVTKTAEGDYTVTGTATDGADNSATDSASVRIDKTKPTITATATGSKNAAGWYKDDATVTYTASDELSGVSGTPANDVLREGRNQSASATVTDAAGNSASAGVSGIDVDKTDPVLTGSFGSGWHTDDVTVSWTCTDALSGAKSQPADTTVTGEGTNLSSTASCEDLAGNATTKTVTGIKIDRTNPTTQATVADPNGNGWYGDAVQVTLTGSDNGSGIDNTFYKVDEGSAQTYAGAFSFGTEGTHEITFWSNDKAGNVETAGAPITLKIDKTAPETAVVLPSTDSGWYVTSGIPVAFNATDDRSGVQATYYKIDNGQTQIYGEGSTTGDLSTGSHTITYWSVDLAGNDEAEASLKTTAFQIDTAAPTVTPGDVIKDTIWRNSSLTQAFTASDAGSGLADTADAAFTLEASAESTKDTSGAIPTTVSKTVSDKAGNVTTRKVSALIDLTKPTNVTFENGPSDGARYYTNTVPGKPTCTADDSLSGLASCTVSGYSTAEGGPYTMTATATDNAGNTATATRTYSIRNLRRSGFFAPVDMNGIFNTIKGGNTVPLKFEVFDGTQEQRDKAVVQNFTTTKVNCTTAAEDAVEVFATTGQTELRYDVTGDQFIQNWKTPTGSGCYKATMTTIDGQSISALFKTLK